MRGKRFLCFLLCLGALSAQSNTVDSLKELIKPLYPDSQRASASSRLFRHYMRNGNTDSAVYYNNLIASLYKNTGNPKYNGIYFHHRALIHHNTGSNDSAIHFYEESVKFRLKANDQNGLGVTYNNLGNAWKNKGNQEKARFFLEKSLEIKRKLKDEKGTGQSLFNVGNVKVTLGLYKQALENYLEALQIGEKTKFEELVMSCHGSLGNVYSIINDDSKAYAHFINALEMARKSGEKRSEAIYLNNLASYYYNKKDTARTIEFYTKSLEIDRKTDNKYGLSMTLSALGSIEGDRENYKQAMIYFDEALKLAHEAGHREAECSILSYLSKLYVNQNDYKKAAEMATKGVGVATEISDMKNLMDFYSVRSVANRALGNYKDAYDDYVKLTALKDSSQQVNNVREMATMEMKKEYEKQQAIERAEQQKREALAKEEAQKEKWIKFALTAVAGFILLIALLVFRSYRQKTKDNRIILNQKAEVELQKLIVEEKSLILEEKNKEITDSIKYAKRLQDAILPHEDIIKKHLPESFILYMPKDIIAGDFYWFEVVNSINRGDMEKRSLTEDKVKLGSTSNLEHHTSNIMIAACDCTGHGVPGALVSVVCSNALNRSVKEFNLTEPGQILDKTRELVLETFAASDKDVKDGMDISLLSIERKYRVQSRKLSGTEYQEEKTKRGDETERKEAERYLSKGSSTAHAKHQMLTIAKRYQHPDRSVGTSNIEHQTIQWAGANNPLWFTDETGMQEITATKQPVGKSDDPKLFTTHKIELTTGHQFYLFTDGYADQFGGDKGKKFKYKPMQQLLLSVSGKEMNEQHEILKKTFASWKGKLEQVDDVCIIGVRM